MNIKNWFDKGFYDRYAGGFINARIEDFYKKYHKFGKSVSLNTIREYKRGWERADKLINASLISQIMRKRREYTSEKVNQKKEYNSHGKFMGIG